MRTQILCLRVAAGGDGESSYGRSQESVDGRLGGQMTFEFERISSIVPSSTVYSFSKAIVVSLPLSFLLLAAMAASKSTRAAKPSRKRREIVQSQVGFTAKDSSKKGTRKAS